MTNYNGSKTRPRELRDSRDESVEVKSGVVFVVKVAHQSGRLGSHHLRHALKVPPVLAQRQQQQCQIPLAPTVGHLRQAIPTHSPHYTHSSNQRLNSTACVWSFHYTNHQLRNSTETTKVGWINIHLWSLSTCPRWPFIHSPSKIRSWDRRHRVRQSNLSDISPASKMFDKKYIRRKKAFCAIGRKRLSNFLPLGTSHFSNPFVPTSATSPLASSPGLLGSFRGICLSLQSESPAFLRVHSAFKN